MQGLPPLDPLPNAAVSPAIKPEPNTVALTLVAAVLVVLAGFGLGAWVLANQDSTVTFPSTQAETEAGPEDETEAGPEDETEAGPEDETEAGLEDEVPARPTVSEPGSFCSRGPFFLYVTDDRPRLTLQNSAPDMVTGPIRTTRAGGMDWEWFLNERLQFRYWVPTSAERFEPLATGECAAPAAEPATFCTSGPFLNASERESSSLQAESPQQVTGPIRSETLQGQQWDLVTHGTSTRRSWIPASAQRVDESEC